MPVMTAQRNNIIRIAFVFSALLLLATYYHSRLLPDRIGLGALVGTLDRTPDEHDGDEHGGDKPRFIFVDLGANLADTLEVFLKHENAKFQFDFPCPEWATHDQAEIYLFEANPRFNTALIQAKERYDALGIKVTIFPSTVVDVRDGTRTFFLDTVNDAWDYLGSSIYANHPVVVESKSKGTELSAINISRWLLMNTLPRDFVVVKMDIEGSEYEVVPHMAEMGVWSVVDYLFVEWHDWLPEEGLLNHALAEAASQKLIAEGVNMPQYLSPS